MKVLIGLTLGLTVLTSMLPVYGQTPEYDYECYEPEIVFDGLFWKIDTSFLKDPYEGSFNARRILRRSIEVTVSYNFEDNTYLDVTINPMFVFKTKDALYMGIRPRDVPPYDAEDVTVRVTGQLRWTGETFISSGPGPGFRRRP